MARFRHISTKLVLVLDAGTENGKKRTKRVTISNIKEDASADALWELAQALGKLLAYPVAEVRLYKVEAVEREEGDETADKNGGIDKEAATDMAHGNGNEDFPAFVPRGVHMLAEHNKKTEHGRQTMYSKQAARLGGHTPLLPSLLENETPKIRPSPQRRKKQIPHAMLIKRPDICKTQKRYFFRWLTQQSG